MKPTKTKTDWLDGLPRPPAKGFKEMTPAEQEDALRRWGEITDYDFSLEKQLEAAERCIGSCLRRAGLPGDLRGLNRAFKKPPTLVKLVAAARATLANLIITRNALAAGDWPRVASRAYLLGVAVEQLRARVNYGTMTGAPWAAHNVKPGPLPALAHETAEHWRTAHAHEPSDGQLYGAIRADRANVRKTGTGKYQYRVSRGWRVFPSIQSFRNQCSRWRKQGITI